jgi:hypothetical protein
MDQAQTRRLWLTFGGGVAVLAIALGAAFVILLHGGRTASPPPAAVGGLVVQTQAGPDAKLDPQKPLRCFVNGQLVGEETLADCARRNGVATDALDVGVDQSGQLAAAESAGTNLTPLPPSAAPVAAVEAAPAAATVQEGDCLRYAAATWRKAGATMSLSGCVKLLFDGQCLKTGAAYGRWMALTLRLVPGAVEVSGDNRNFRLLVEQPASCAIPDFQETRSP